MATRQAPRWWGGRWHIVFTVIIFVILASLDNAAIGLIPPLYPIIARDLGVRESALGMVTAASFLLTALSAVGFGYLGDRTGRKRLLLWGTVIWAGGVVMTGFVHTFTALLLWQMLTAVGLGCIASVGFSVISDFITPRWRGLVMSLWGLSQGIGTLAGGMLGGLLGKENWQLPFLFMGALGAAFAVLYLLCYDPPRGRAEPELSRVFAAGGQYEYTIGPGDLRRLLLKPSNVWLILQGFFAQFAFGANVWMSRLFTARVQAEGYPVETAVAVGALFATLFSLGGLLSVLGGWLGDLWQRKNPGGRALLSAIGILGSIPLFVALFFLPLHGIEIPPGGSVVAAVLRSVVLSPWVAGAFALSIGAQALNGANSPNWFALITDANLPEHRGTVYALGNLANGVGRAIGNGLTGVVSVLLAVSLPEPMNFAVGLTIFQAFFIPTGICYLLAARTSPQDIADVKQTLNQRAKVAG
ncbi:MAG TPA: MFS transporter [Symbiobacteriaceae bacterium]|nr:MFS transporter [Symbiobacteriaceae bacterium]